MGSPDNCPPPRPASVPADARWDPGKSPGFEWKLGEVDSEGRKHGVYRSWTRDGVLHAESVYEHGELHGTNRNYHPDGTLASEAEWVRGVIMNSVYYRSEAPSSEPFAAQAAPTVWSVRYFTRDGRTNYTIRYFLRDGTECGPDGKQLPPRPASVSPDARWFPDMERWVDGAIERGTNRQVGRWRWWSPDGVLRHEEMRDERGEATMIGQYEADGTLEKRTTRTPDGEQRDYFFPEGQLSSRYREDAQGRELYKASWRRDGHLVEEITRTFDDAGLVAVRERREGVLAFEARREGPHGLACVLYADDGKTPAASGLWEAGMLAGTWRVLDERGAIRRTVDMTPLRIVHGVTGEDLAWRIGEALYRTDEPDLPTPAELAGVDGEPWAETAGCYGDDVEAFPRLLRALVAPDPLVRQYALGTIAGEIEHQGATYPASARAVPYLARLLAHPAAERSALLALIQEVGEGALPYVDEVGELDEHDDERFAIEGTVRAVAAAWPHVFALFATASPEDRRRILALARFAREAKANIADLARHAADPALRACAVDSVTTIAGWQVADIAPCLADRDPLVRAATAIAIGCAKGPESPKDVVHALGEALRGARELAPRFAALPHATGHLVGHVALAAGAIRTADARSLIQALCGALDDVDGASAITVGEGLLALALGNGERPYAKRCVEVLDALARSKQFWAHDGEARDLLARHRLPRERAALIKLVGELQAASDAQAVLHARLHA